MMGPNYQSNTGDIKSLNPGQILLPKNKWEYGFINSLVWSWINLNLTMSKPDFPNKVIIQLHSNSTESLRRFSGSFGKDDQLSHRDLPVWVNKDFVGSCVERQGACCAVRPGPDAGTTSHPKECDKSSSEARIFQ